jgi:AcrR family transcriptional regulator
MVTMNIDDRRVRRSRKLLGDALLSLLEAHDFDTIKIRDVTEKADVGYMTFYRHYDSLEELLTDRIRSILEEQIAEVIACDQQGELIFSYVADNAKLYRTLLFSPSTARARQKLADMFAEFFAITAKDDPLIPADLRARHMATGLLSLAGWWLEKNMLPPVPQVAEMYNALIINDNIDPEKLRQLTVATCIAELSHVTI